MHDKSVHNTLDRRTFLKTGALAAAAAGGAAVAQPAPASGLPDGAYRTLGRTGLKLAVIGIGTFRLTEPAVMQFAFDQDSQLAADETLEVALSQGSFQFGQPFDSLGLDRLRDLIGHLGRGRAPPRAEGEDVNLGETGLLGDAAGGFEICFSLAGKTDNNVSRQCRLIE